jgi:hypothetical protein
LCFCCVPVINTIETQTILETPQNPNNIRNTTVTQKITGTAENTDNGRNTTGKQTIAGTSLKYGQ